MTGDDVLRVIERRLYVTIGPDGEPHDVFSGYEAAAHDAATTLRSVQVVVPEYQHQGAVCLTDAERERLLWWLHRPVPPGPMKDLDVALIAKLTTGRGQ